MNSLRKIYARSIALIATSVSPLAAMAADVDSIVNAVTSTLNRIIGLLFVIATVIFLWGLIQYIANASDEAKRKQSKGIMTWGIVGLAVMVAAWGVVNIINAYFFGPGTGPVRGIIPTRPGGL